ncbi:MAG: hypothetical protein U0J81_02255, partial [Collinsella sp.]|nr:hypothetical protein [Collinsella sp.]
MLKFILVIHDLILIYVNGKVSFMDRGFFNRAVLRNIEKVLPYGCEIIKLWHILYERFAVRTPRCPDTASSVSTMTTSPTVA